MDGSLPQVFAFSEEQAALFFVVLIVRVLEVYWRLLALDQGPWQLYDPWLVFWRFLAGDGFEEIEAAFDVEASFATGCMDVIGWVILVDEVLVPPPGLAAAGSVELHVPALVEPLIEDTGGLQDQGLELWLPVVSYDGIGRQQKLLSLLP